MYSRACTYKEDSLVGTKIQTINSLGEWERHWSNLQWIGFRLRVGVWVRALVFIVVPCSAAEHIIAKEFSEIPEFCHLT